MKLFKCHYTRNNERFQFTTHSLIKRDIGADTYRNANCCAEKTDWF